MYLEALLRFYFLGVWHFMEFCCNIILFVKIFMNVYGINPMKINNANENDYVSKNCYCLID